MSCIVQCCKYTILKLAHKHPHIICTHTHMHTHTHIHIHTCTHTHMLTQDPGLPAGVGQDFDNCKVLDETLQLSWRVDNDNSQVQFQLCGCTATDPKYVGITNTHTKTCAVCFPSESSVVYHWSTFLSLCMT